MIALVSDISERKQQEERIQLLMQEVNHRVKNIFSVVQAVARESANAQPDSFLERFAERIQALAANHQLLTESQWQGVDIEPASQNLFDLIQSQAMVLYPDDAMRLAVSRAVAVETPRGWRIGRDKQAFKVDVVIALGLSAYAAVVAQDEPYFDQTWQWVNGVGSNQTDAKTRQQQEADDAPRHSLSAHSSKASRQETSHRIALVSPAAEMLRLDHLVGSTCY